MSAWHRGLDDDPDTTRIAAAEHRRDHRHDEDDQRAERAYEQHIHGDHR